jgi:2-dehydropantoate 2-reductase
MRFVVYGVGAIGGTLAARLAASGAEVAGIARGAQLEALRRDGLLLRTPDGAQRHAFPVVAHPREVELRPDDVILLAMKSQDTVAALEALASAGARDQAIVCAQNGVDNERQALRRFANVYAMLVVMPATFMRAGEVAVFGAPNAGLFDIGRYPSGIDATVAALVAALTRAGFAAFATERTMEAKYGKPLVNLANVIDAASAGGEDTAGLIERARREGEAVLRAAGIAFTDVSPDNARRRSLMQPQPVAGAERVGSSSRQSLLRGAGSIETDYLTGEVVLLGRLHGVPTPINAGLCRLGRLLLSGQRPAGGLRLNEIESIVSG